MICCSLSSTLPDDSVRNPYANYARIKEVKIKLQHLKKEYRKTKRGLFLSKFIRSIDRGDLIDKLRHLENEKVRLKYELNS